MARTCGHRHRTPAQEHELSTKGTEANSGGEGVHLWGAELPGLRPLQPRGGSQTHAGGIQAMKRDEIVVGAHGPTASSAGTNRGDKGGAPQEGRGSGGPSGGRGVAEAHAPRT